MSPFAKALKKLIDETTMFDRDEWANFHGVEADKIEAWVTDKTIPRPEYLRMTLDLLKNSADIPSGPLEEFEKLLDLPLRDVTPLPLSQSTLRGYLAYR